VVRVKRGEVWWARVDERRPIVLLSGPEPDELRAMQIVAPATAAEKRGFLVLSGEEACDARQRERALAADVSAVGVEVGIGLDEGLPFDGVVRLALPRDGRIFCTWLLTLTPDHLIERVGELSPAKLEQLDTALRLSSTG
jgi:mRNA interferase MazF